MEINNLLDMNTNIVFGIVNERLRHECANLDELISRYDLNETQLMHKMALIGYEYDAVSNQFKSCY